MSKVQYVKDNFKDFWVDEAPKHDWWGGEGCVQHPVHGGKQTNCRSTLYTLTRMLKPKNVLEIGSWHYSGSNFISLAMQHEGIEGQIDSFDIMRGGFDGQYVKPRFDNINPWFWMPHHTTYDDWKYRNPNIVHPRFMLLDNTTIFEENLKNLKSVTPKGGYDMIFIDGDHSLVGASFDWAYAHEVGHDDSVILIDDLYESRLTEVRQFWDQIVTEKYDFDDWNNVPGNPLISVGICLPEIAYSESL